MSIIEPINDTPEWNYLVHGYDSDLQIHVVSRNDEAPIAKDVGDSYGTVVLQRGDLNDQGLVPLDYCRPMIINILPEVFEADRHLTPPD